MKRDSIIALGVLGIILVAAILRHIINTNSVLFILALVPSVILHEVSHGVVANIFGDDTAKKSGRLSLNPLVHIDLFGTLILPAIMILAGIPPLGYAKPVPVNISKLRNPRNHSVAVSLIGPVVNIAISVVAGLVLRNILTASLTSSPLATQAQLGNSLWVQYLFDLGVINVALAVFNLIPIPPLDGSVVVERFLPSSMLPGYFRIRRFAMPVLIVIFLLFPAVFDHLILSLDNTWISLFVPLG